MRPMTETDKFFGTIPQILTPREAEFVRSMERQRDDARKIAEQYIVKNADMQNEIERLNCRLSNQYDTIAEYQNKSDETRKIIDEKNTEIVALLEEISGLKKHDPITDGGPAFPGAFLFDQAVIDRTGMALRDWFAGMALQGVLAPCHDENGDCVLAERAYHIADAMLAARNGKVVA